MSDADPGGLIGRTEWEHRFKARIAARLTGSNELGDGWTQEQAQEAASRELGGAGFEHLYESWEHDPEGSADEALYYWADYLWG